ncbi:MAG: hypothetical protein RR069_01320 [Oscillospiraceae bacterium]
MKRILSISSLLLAFLMIFSSCSGSKDSALSVGKGQVGKDVFAYYVDYVIVNENKDKKMPEEQIVKRANELCLEYIKINTKFSEMKLSLHASVKAQIADKVTNTWGIFENYYTSIGVSKQTLTKIQENLAFRDTLLLAIYDTNGTNPVDEDSLKSYFKDNYIFFKSINEYFKTTNENGKEIDMTPASVTAIKNKFNEMATSISQDNTIDAVNSAYAQSIGQPVADAIPISVIDKASTSYPAGFFGNVSEISGGQVKVLTLEDYIFLVQRIDNFDESQNFYKTYRIPCLKEMVANEFTKTVSDWYKDSKVNPNERAQRKCYDQIVDVRSEK